MLDCSVLILFCRALLQQLMCKIIDATGNNARHAVMYLHIPYNQCGVLKNLPAHQSGLGADPGCGPYRASSNLMNAHHLTNHKLLM